MTKRSHTDSGMLTRFDLAPALAVAALLVLGPALARAAAPDSVASGAATVVGGVPATADSARRVTTHAGELNAAPIARKRVELIGKPENVVRSGPGNEYSIVGVFAHGMSFDVISKSGDWYDIRVSGTQTGWVHSSLCRELDDLSGFEFKPNPKLYTRTGSYVLTGYGGAYAYDRKSNSLVLGGRLSYYVFDRVVAEAGVSWTHVRRAREIVESLFGLSLEAEDFHMLFYQLNLTYEVLPGRQMVPFVTGGVGSTIMLGRAEPSFNFGAGTKLFISKRTAMRWEVRDFHFKSGAGSGRVTNNNIEFTLGTEHLF
jgi:outer membrane beta-barrel protein